MDLRKGCKALVWEGVIMIEVLLVLATALIVASFMGFVLTEIKPL